VAFIDGVKGKGRNAAATQLAPLRKKTIHSRPALGQLVLHTSVFVSAAIQTNTNGHAVRRDGHRAPVAQSCLLERLDLGATRSTVTSSQ